MATPDDAGSGPRRRRWGVVAWWVLVGCVVTAVTAADVVLLPGTDARSGLLAASGTDPSLLDRWLPAACAPGDAVCRRRAADAARRTPLALGTAERAVAGMVGRDIRDAADRQATGACESLRAQDGDLAERCRYQLKWRLPTAYDVAAVRDSLDDAGYPDAVVRLARADDPAPTGTLLYAVGYGDLCFVQYLRSGFDGATVMGRLADGACLDP